MNKKQCECKVIPSPFAVLLNEDDRNYVEPDAGSALIRNFLSLGITLLFHIHKGIIGCRQALDFLAFRYFL